MGRKRRFNFLDEEIGNYLISLSNVLMSLSNNDGFLPNFFYRFRFSLTVDLLIILLAVVMETCLIVDISLTLLPAS